MGRNELMERQRRAMVQPKLLAWCGSSGFCRETLDELYACLNRREYIHPDPLELVREFPDPLDREVVGMVASALAYGRVQQILRSVAAVLERMGESPLGFIMASSLEDLQRAFSNFRHRFTGGSQMAGLLHGLKQVIRRHGSLEACFVGYCGAEDDSILPALRAFVRELRAEIPCRMDMLLPDLDKGSACKRLNLFLRWMVRIDEVDPGGWHGVDPRLLMVPLDTHMHRIALEAGLTQRRQGDMRTACEITRAFRSITPEDPVRYDFALTRLGIRGIESGRELARSYF